MRCFLALISSLLVLITQDANLQKEKTVHPSVSFPAFLCSSGQVWHLPQTLKESPAERSLHTLTPQCMLVSGHHHSHT